MQNFHVRMQSNQRNAEYINGLQGLATFFYDDKFDLSLGCKIIAIAAMQLTNK